jgi:hypothetical protein
MADQVGIQVEKREVDAFIGALLLKLNTDIIESDAFKDWADARAVSDLEDIGYTTSEANLVKTIAGSLGEIITCYETNKTFLTRAFGFGVAQRG